MFNGPGALKQRAQVGGGYDVDGPAAYPSTAMEGKAPEGQIVTALREQEKVVSALLDVVNELEGRLSPFLRPTPPTGNACGDAVPTPMRSDLAQRLGSTNSELFMATERIRSLISRVDL